MQSQFGLAVHHSTARVCAQYGYDAHITVNGWGIQVHMCVDTCVHVRMRPTVALTTLCLLFLVVCVWIFCLHVVFAWYVCAVLTKEDVRFPCLRITDSPEPS